MANTYDMAFSKMQTAVKYELNNNFQEKLARKLLFIWIYSIEKEMW